MMIPYAKVFTVALLAMVPLTESRGSIPFGIAVLHLSPLLAYFFSMLGNFVPLLLLFLFLPKCVRWISDHSPRVHAILEAYFFRLAKRHETALNTYGALFLFFFVAIPHPAGGVYSASLLAILFRLKPRIAIPAIISGMLVSGAIILSITEGSVLFFRHV